MVCRGEVIYKLDVWKSDICNLRRSLLDFRILFGYPELEEEKSADS